MSDQTLVWENSTTGSYDGVTTINNGGVSFFTQTVYTHFAGIIVSNKMSEQDLRIINNSDRALSEYIKMPLLEDRYDLNTLDENFLNQLVQVYRTGYRLEIMFNPIMFNPYALNIDSLTYKQNRDLMMRLAYNCSDEDQRILGLIALTILKKRNYELYTSNSNNRS